jgi:hypothetical protein
MPIFPSSLNPSFASPPFKTAMDEITKVEAQIEAASKKVEGLFARKSLHKDGKGSFGSDEEKELQYWINEKEALVKKGKDLREKENLLREKENLLLRMSIHEMESKALIFLSIFYKLSSS